MSPSRRIKSTNPDLISLIRLLGKKSKENNASIWQDVARKLSKPKRSRIKVNVSKINRHSKENEGIVVPGKVLGAGIISHPVTVAALAFSQQAKSKIVKAKGKCLSIAEIAEENPDGSNLRIIG
jgi:large subunit ribosomal protein L18e